MELGKAGSRVSKKADSRGTLHQSDNFSASLLHSLGGKPEAEGHEYTSLIVSRLAWLKSKAQSKEFKGPRVASTASQ